MVRVLPTHLGGAFVLVPKLEILWALHLFHFVLANFIDFTHLQQGLACGGPILLHEPILGQAFLADRRVREAESSQKHGPGTHKNAILEMSLGFIPNKNKQKLEDSLSIFLIVLSAMFVGGTMCHMPMVNKNRLCSTEVQL